MSYSITSNRRHRTTTRLLMVMACGNLFFGRAFQQYSPTAVSSSARAILRSNSGIAAAETSRRRRFLSPSSTTLHARKGNRGSKNKKMVSEAVEKRSRSAVNDVLDGITEDPKFPYSVDPADTPAGPVEADPLAPLVRTIVRAADMRKAQDVVALRVSHCSSTTSFVVIASGTSRPQNQAISAAVSDDVAGGFDGKRCLGNGCPEGTADSGWILLDYGEVMVHVMTPKSRLFYDLERQWRDRGGEYMDLSDVIMNEQSDAVLETGEGQTMKERLDVEKVVDPFWS